MKHTILAVAIFCSGWAHAEGRPAAVKVVTEESADLPQLNLRPNNAKGPLVVAGHAHGRKSTLACKDKQVVLVEGHGNHVTVTGNCGTVTITGERNHIFLSSADSVTVDGNKNEIVYSGTQPSFSAHGEENTITAAK